MTDQSAKKAGQYYSGKLDRRDVIQLLATARRNQSYRFGRQTAMIWLANFPGDLEVRVELGMTFLAERKFHQAKSILESVVLHDPEYIQAYMGLNDVYVAMGSDLIVDNLGIIMGLGGQPFVTEVPEWAKTMAIIRGLAKDSNYGCRGSCAPVIGKSWSFHSCCTVTSVGKLLREGFHLCLYPGKCVQGTLAGLHSI